MADKYDDDLDFDVDKMEGMDWDSDPFDSENVQDDRSPVTKVLTGAADEVLSMETGSKALKAIKQNTLPEGYVKAIDLADDTATFGRDIYSKVEKELEPASKALKKAIRANDDVIEKYLPNFISSRLKSFSGKADSAQDASVDQNELAIASASKSIFDKYQPKAMELARTEAETAERSVDRKITKLQHVENKNLIAGVSEGISRLVGYQDLVLYDYHRKSLELQHRQYFATRDLLEVTRASAEITKTNLQAISKNTGLPDAVKLRLSEQYGFMIQQDLISRVQGGLHDYLFNAGDRVKEGIKGKVDNFTRQFKDFASMGAEAATELSEQRKAMAEMGTDSLEESGRMAGDTATSFATNRLALKLANIIRPQTRDDIAAATTSLAKEKLSMGWEVEQSFKETIRLLLEREEPPSLNDVLDSSLYGNPEHHEAIKEAIDELSNSDKNRIEKDLIAQQKQFKKASEVTTGLGKFTEYGAKLNNKISNLPRIINSAIKEGKELSDLLEEDSSLRPLLDNELVRATFDSLKEMHGRYSENYDLTSNYAEKAFESAYFDVQTRRSIVEIIPGYLSRILQQTTQFNSKKQEERLVFSMEQEGFIKQSAQMEDTARRLFNQEAISDRQAVVKTLSNKIDATQKLTEGQLSLLSERLITLYAEGDALTIPRLIRTRTPNESDGDAAAINAMLASGDFTEQRFEKELLPLFNRINDTSKTMAEAISYLDARGRREEIKALGILKDDGEFDNEQVMSITRQNTDVDQYFKERIDAIRGTSAIDPATGSGGLGQISFDRFFPITTPDNVQPVFVVNTKEETAPVIEPRVEANVNVDTQPIVSEISKTNLLLEAISRKIEEFNVSQTINNYEDNGGFNIGGLISGTGSAIGSTVSGIGSYFKSIGTLGISAASAVGGAALSIGDRLLGQAKGLFGRDIYVKGEEQPILTVRQMSTGKFIDENTGNVVKSISDITGPVLDEDGNYRITAEDFETGFEYRDGTTIGSMVNKVGGLIGSYYGTLGELAQRAIALPGEMLNNFSKSLKTAQDVYVGGEDKPRLLGHLMRNNGYFDADGQVIDSVDKITHYVYDRDGNLKLSPEDIEKGLFNKWGIKLTFKDGALGAAGAIAGAAFNKIKDAGKWGLDKGKAYYQWLGEKASDGWNWGKDKAIQFDETRKTEFQKLKVQLEEQGLTLEDLKGMSADDLKDKFNDIDFKKLKISSGDQLQKWYTRTAEALQNVNLPMLAFSSGALPILKAQLEIQRALLAEARGETYDPNFTLPEMDDDESGLKGKSVNYVKQILSGTITGAKRLFGAGAAATEDVMAEANAGVEAILTGSRLSNTAIQKAQLEVQRAILAHLKGEPYSLNIDIPEAEDDAERAALKARVSAYVSDIVERDSVKKLKEKAINLSQEAQDALDAIKESTKRSADEVTEENESEDRTVEDASQKNLLQNIRESIDKLRAKATRSSDSDGDGFRDGSWRDSGETDKEARREARRKRIEELRARRDARRESRDDDERDASDDSKDRGMLGSLAEKLGVPSELIDAAESLGDMFDLGGGDDNDDNGTNRRRNRSGGRTGGAGKRGLLRTAGRLLLSPLRMAASAAIANPVAAVGVVGAAAAAYGAYKGYKWLSMNSAIEAMEALRFMQYGIKNNDTDKASVIRNIEEMVDDELTPNGMSYSWKGNVDDLYQSVADKMVMDPGNPQTAEIWGDWFKNRFLRIFILHKTALNALSLNIDLKDIDDELTKFEDKIKYLNLVKLDPKALKNWPFDPLQVMSSGFEPAGAIPSRSDCEGYWDMLMADAKAGRETDDVEGTSLLGRFTSSVVGGVAAVAGGVNNFVRNLTGVDIKETYKKYGVRGLDDKDEKTGLTRLHSGALMMEDKAIIGGATATMATWALKKYQLDNELSKPMQKFEKVRMLQYGFTETTLPLRAYLRQLEKVVAHDLEWAGYKPNLKQKVEKYLKLSKPLLAISDHDTQRIELWKKWFEKRFLPIYLLHESLARSSGFKTVKDIDGIENSKNHNAIYSFLKAVNITPTNSPDYQIFPLNVIANPFKDVALNATLGKVQDYITSLLEAVKLAADKVVDEVSKTLDPAELKPIELETAPKVTKAQDVSKEVAKDIAREEARMVALREVPETPVALGQKTFIDTDNAGKVAGIKKDSYLSQSSTVEFKDDQITLPVDGRLSSKFGRRVHPITGEADKHKGIDIAAASGTPVRAAADGVVIDARAMRGYGNTIRIDHGFKGDKRYESLYAHLSKFASHIEVGVRVNRGDIIGYVGSTGGSTGAHLHFEYYRIPKKGQWSNRQLFDPISKLPGLAVQFAEQKDIVTDGNEQSANENVDNISKPAEKAVQRPAVTTIDNQTTQQIKPAITTPALTQKKPEKPIEVVAKVDNGTVESLMSRQNTTAEKQTEILTSLKDTMETLIGVVKENGTRTVPVPMAPVEETTVVNSKTENRFGVTQSTTSRNPITPVVNFNN